MVIQRNLINLQVSLKIFGRSFYVLWYNIVLPGHFAHKIILYISFDPGNGRNGEISHLPGLGPGFNCVEFLEKN